MPMRGLLNVAKIYVEGDSRDLLNAGFLKGI